MGMAISVKGIRNGVSGVRVRVSAMEASQLGGHNAYDRTARMGINNFAYVTRHHAVVRAEVVHC